MRITETFKTAYHKISYLFLKIVFIVIKYTLTSLLI